VLAVGCRLAARCSLLAARCPLLPALCPQLCPLSATSVATGCWRYYKTRSHARATNTGMKCFVFLGITSWYAPPQPVPPAVLASVCQRSSNAAAARRCSCRAICRVRLRQELMQAEGIRRQIEASQMQVRQRPSGTDDRRE
jgi:hypothetical protein